MKARIENTKRDLGRLGKISAKTDAAEKRILAAASARLNVVNDQINRAVTGIEGAPESSQDRYLDLVNERAQLNLVIARARKVLSH